ncbi:YdcF family protein [Stella sp.]|uniref:YdcF family protein n=1 Tax=Stella sp. TaxID=2912054 RepID=UPI0035B10C36
MIAGLARLARRLLWAGLAVALALVAGFVWFAESIPWSTPADDTPTDAIVVLTGGPDRIPEGAALLVRGLAQKLFVSGVHPDVDLPVMLRNAGVGETGRADRIVLGHAAADTRGNAVETARWMAQEGFRSLRLVTANYHLWRAERELRRTMPEVRFVLHPVVPTQMRRDWWAARGTAMLLASEYAKYLWSFVRPRSSH